MRFAKSDLCTMEIVLQEEPYFILERILTFYLIKVIYHKISYQILQLGGRALYFRSKGLGYKSRKSSFLFFFNFFIFKLAITFFRGKEGSTNLLKNLHICPQKPPISRNSGQILVGTRQFYLVKITFLAQIFFVFSL